MNPEYLNETAPGVPFQRNPFCWDTHRATESNLAILNRHIEKYHWYLPEGASIDEAAIMVPNAFHARLLGRQLNMGGWEHFNSAKDLVHTTPFGTRYIVQYRFFRHPDVSYRLEVMHMDMGQEDNLHGFSPVHAALWPEGEAPSSGAGLGLMRYPVPHLSFKPVRREYPAENSNPSRKQTWLGAYNEAVEHLRSQDFLHAQTCKSTYGLFGYHLPRYATSQLYLKPRINTRDDA